MGVIFRTHPAGQMERALKPAAGFSFGIGENITKGGIGVDQPPGAVEHAKREGRAVYDLGKQLAPGFLPFSPCAPRRHQQAAAPAFERTEAAGAFNQLAGLGEKDNLVAFTIVFFDRFGDFADFPDRCPHGVKTVIQQIKQRRLAPERNPGPVGPDDASTGKIPQPGRIGLAFKVLKKFCLKRAHGGYSPLVLYLTHTTNIPAGKASRMFIPIAWMFAIHAFSRRIWLYH